MAKQRGNATFKQHFCKVPAHRGGRLLIVVGVKLLGKHHGRFGQPLWRYRDVDQHTGSPGEDRAIAESKKGQAKVGEDAVLGNGLRGETGQGVIAVAARKLIKEIYGTLSR
jgi:hypothetical protein